MTLETIENRLGLKPHPEGGSYAEFYRGTDVLRETALPPRFTEDRNTATAIYYLLKAGEKSLFHRIQSDEIWVSVGGGALELMELDEEHGTKNEYVLGHDIEHGQVLSTVIPAGHWFAARPLEDVEYALTVCIAAPGFELADYRMASRTELLGLFPEYSGIVHEFTRRE